MKHTSATSERLYRVRIICYPDGALKECPFEGTVIDPAWQPAGWEPDEQYVADLKTTRFVWPSTKHMYWTKQAALGRAALVEKYGATAVVERTPPIQWELYTEPEPLFTEAKADARPSVRDRLYAYRDEDSREVLAEKARRVRELMERWNEES